MKRILHWLGVFVGDEQRHVCILQCDKLPPLILLTVLLYSSGKYKMVQLQVELKFKMHSTLKNRAFSNRQFIPNFLN